MKQKFPTHFIYEMKNGRAVYKSGRYQFTKLNGEKFEMCLNKSQAKFMCDLRVRELLGLPSKTTDPNISNSILLMEEIHPRDINKWERLG